MLDDRSDRVWEVPYFMRHDPQTEEVRLTRSGAARLLVSDVVSLEDPATDYRHVLKGRDLLESIAATGEPQDLKVCRVRVLADTDDIERMVAACQVVTELNPTGQPPYMLPAED